MELIVLSGIEDNFVWLVKTTITPQIKTFIEEQNKQLEGYGIIKIGNEKDIKMSDDPVCVADNETDAIKMMASWANAAKSSAEESADHEA